MCPKALISGGSIIDNASYEYHGEAVDYYIDNTPGGCSTCGVSGPPTGNTLPSLKVTRLFRPRFAEFTPGNLHASFGKGHYWKEVDRSLRIQSNGQIRVLDPTDFDKKIITTFNAGRGGWADLEDEAFSVLTLFDENDIPIASAADKRDARSAVLLHHNGTTEHYEIFWRRTTESAIGGDGTRGFGRLTAIMDRNANAIQIEYERAVEADGVLGEDTETNAQTKVYYYQSWRKSKVIDAYGKEILITNGTGNHNNNRITKLELPNGEEITYGYGKLSVYKKTLKTVNLPDGSTSTWTGVKYGVGQIAITQSDRSASAGDQKKIIYISRKQGPDGNGGIISSTPRLVRRVDNGAGEMKYANREVDDGFGGFTTYIYEGGNRVIKGLFSTIGGATNLEYVTTPGAGTDFFNPNPGQWATVPHLTDQSFDNRALLTSKQDIFTRSTSLLYDSLSKAVVGTTMPDGTTETVTYNQFRQPLL